MGAGKSRPNVFAIDEVVMKEPVVLYTRNSCNYCMKAKSIIGNYYNLRFKEVNLDVLAAGKPAEYEGIRSGLERKTHKTSVPQIFICGKHIGGSDELEELHKAGKLLDAVTECGGGPPRTI